MKKKSCVIVIFILVLAAGTELYADDGPTGREKAADIFDRANEYYDEGDYEKAISAYESILSGGRKSGPVYYNLANAYFRSGETGKAVLNYERARRLIPRDPDLRANYSYALAGIRSRVLANGSIWRKGIFADYRALFTLNEMILIALASYLGVLVSITIAVRSIRMRRYLVVLAVLAGTVLLINVMIIPDIIEARENAAVVTADNADVMYGPFSSATRFFSLDEGAKVRVLEEKQEWAKVRRADGKVGWLERDDIELI
jgi:tetratricopeptide (TPR) repeat protein